jgi:hypothetical protein
MPEFSRETPEGKTNRKTSESHTRLFSLVWTVSRASKGAVSDPKPMRVACSQLMGRSEKSTIDLKK